MLSNCYHTTNGAQSNMQKILYSLKKEQGIGIKVNSFEKLLMVVVPSISLVVIMSFFIGYLPDLENGNFYDNQRLQGSISGQSKVAYKKMSSLSPTREKDKPLTRSNNFDDKNYIKWKGSKKITHIQNSLKNYKYRQIPNSSRIEYKPTNNIKFSQLPRQKVQTRKVRQNNKKINNLRQCAYYEKMKKKIEGRMKRGYKAWEFQLLEDKRKYWAKKYTDNCFDGYRYPR